MTTSEAGASMPWSMYARTRRTLMDTVRRRLGLVPDMVAVQVAERPQCLFDERRSNRPARIVSGQQVDFIGDRFAPDHFQHESKNTVSMSTNASTSPWFACTSRSSLGGTPNAPLMRSHTDSLRGATHARREATQAAPSASLQSTRVSCGM